MDHSGSMSVAGEVVSPGKAKFVEAVAGAVSSGVVSLALDLSGYGEGGWHKSAGQLSSADVYAVALAAWYELCAVPAPPPHLLHQEAGLFARGEVTVRVPDDGALLGLRFLRSDLELVWCEETSAGGFEEFRRSRGQCAVTALLVQERFGGDLLRVVTPEGSHYFNRLPDGREVDLTRDQFDAWLPSGPPEVRSREYVLSHEGTRRRFELLRDLLGS